MCVRVWVWVVRAWDMNYVSRWMEKIVKNQLYVRRHTKCTLKKQTWRRISGNDAFSSVFWENEKLNMNAFENHLASWQTQPSISIVVLFLNSSNNKCQAFSSFLRQNLKVFICLEWKTQNRKKTELKKNLQNEEWLRTAQIVFIVFLTVKLRYYCKQNFISSQFSWSLFEFWFRVYRIRWRILYTYIKHSDIRM